MSSLQQLFKQKGRLPSTGLVTSCNYLYLFLKTAHKTESSWTFRFCWCGVVTFIFSSICHWSDLHLNSGNLEIIWFLELKVWKAAFWPEVFRNFKFLSTIVSLCFHLEAEDPGRIYKTGQWQMEKKIELQYTTRPVGGRKKTVNSLLAYRIFSNGFKLCFFFCCCWKISSFFKFKSFILIFVYKLWKKVPSFFQQRAKFCLIPSNKIWFITWSGVKKGNKNLKDQKIGI